MNKNKNKKGFSLIEVLVALLIFLFGILSFINLMLVNIRRTQDARSQVIAAMLAQEGVELMINNKSSATNWNNGNYRIDLISGPTASSSYMLYIKERNYQHATDGIATKFSRAVAVDNDASNKIAKIKSYVWWGGDSSTKPALCNSANKCVSITTDVYY